MGPLGHGRYWKGQIQGQREIRGLAIAGERDGPGDAQRLWQRGETPREAKTTLRGDSGAKARGKDSKVKGMENEKG